MVMLKESKKIGVIARETMVAEVKEHIIVAQACFFIGFSRVQAFPFNTLRNNLREAGARVLITKNTLFKLALADIGQSVPDTFLEAETGVVFVNDEDVVKACKILVEFSQENEFIALKGGLIKDRQLTAKELISIAKLPSKEVLMGMAVSAIASPLTGLLVVMNQMILKFVWVVEEIKKVKEKK
jgi:large subunit ribosomal protein L10